MIHDLNGLNNLQTLELNESKIETIDSDAFFLLKNLRNLDIIKFKDSNGLIFVDRKLYVSMVDRLELVRFQKFEEFDYYDLQEFKNRMRLRQETKVHGIGRFQRNQSNEKTIERMQKLYDTDNQDDDDDDVEVISNNIQQLDPRITILLFLDNAMSYIVLVVFIMFLAILTLRFTKYKDIIFQINKF